MGDNFDTEIHELAEEFENIPTTEDERVGIDRRHLDAEECPLSKQNFSQLFFVLFTNYFLPISAMSPPACMPVTAQCSSSSDKSQVMPTEPIA